MFSLTNSQSTPEDLGVPESGRIFFLKMGGFGGAPPAPLMQSLVAAGGGHCLLDPNLQPDF